MKKSLISMALLGLLASMLSGCVIGRHSGVYVPPAVVAAGVGAAVATTIIYEDDVVYPQYETAYVWDPIYECYFFVGPGGYHHYMPRGWGYRSHGVPHGVYLGSHH